jgi:hypothetical protein
MALLTLDMTSWISAWRKDTKLFEWVTLLTEIGFSGVTSFCYVCGATLAGAAGAVGIVGASGYSTSVPKDLLWAVAVGAGMLRAAVMMSVLWRNSPLTKGTTVALPGEEAKTEIMTSSQVLTK